MRGNVFVVTALLFVALGVGGVLPAEARSGFTSLDQSTAKLRWTVLLVMPPI